MVAVIPVGGVRPRIGRGGPRRDCGTHTVFLVCALLTVMVLTASITRTWHNSTKSLKSQGLFAEKTTTSVSVGVGRGGAYDGYGTRRNAVRTRGYRPTIPRAAP